MSIFFVTNQQQKEYIWKKLNKFYPNFKTAGHYFRKYINQNINPDTVILDAGCGAKGIISEFKNKYKKLIGLDNNTSLLNQNKIIDEKIIADLTNMPLKNNSVDVVVSEFVLEHLNEPKKVFQEIARILKPNGVFIFMTPNVFNPIILLSKILPHSLHKFFRKKLLKKQEQTHQTFYNANTSKKLLSLGKNKFECKIKRAGNPEYLGFCKPLVLISIFLEKMIHNKYLSFFKMYLVGYFIKK